MGDLNRSGYSRSLAPFDLSRPAWIWQQPDTEDKRGPFHAGPILDEERNAYIPSISGHLYSVSPAGELRWTLKLEGTDPGNGAILGDALYTATSAGFAYAVDIRTGRELWKVKVGLACSQDAWSSIVFNGTVLVPSTPEAWHPEAHRADSVTPECGSEELVALRASDGEVLWRYGVTKRAGTILYNVLPAIVGGVSVVFDDFSGGVYRLSLADGSEEWFSPGPSPGAWSTGASMVGPTGLVYTARNYETSFMCNKGTGFVRAHDLSSGKLVWEVKFPTVNNVGMAVGPAGPKGRLAVVAAPGDNFLLLPSFPRWLPDPFERCLRWLLLKGAQRMAGSLSSAVVALDPETGETLWRLELDESDLAEPGPYAPGSFCAPDIYGNPSIGADGTVYISWSGGKAFAIRDANGDGKVDKADRRELSSFPHGYGANANPAMAPGFVVFTSCNNLVAFSSEGSYEEPGRI